MMQSLISYLKNNTTRTALASMTVAALVATLLGLTAHIQILALTRPWIAHLSVGINTHPDPSTYSSLIYYSAYATAFIGMVMCVLVYYHAQHLVPGRTKLTKSLFLALIIAAIKVDPFRQPIMNAILFHDIGVAHPIILAFFHQIDQWISLILVAGSIVFFCPRRSTVE